MDKTRTIGQKWLADELVFTFWTLKKHAKFQFNPTIPSRVIVTTDPGQTDTFVKSVFSDSDGFKM